MLKTIATMTAAETEANPACTIVISTEQHPVTGLRYTVHVAGGMLPDGSDEEVFGGMIEALAFAGATLSLILSGG